MVETSEAARRLRGVESDLRSRVQTLLDEAQKRLEAEERELTELKETLPRDEFEARTRDFDRRVRAERRAAQERGAMLLDFVNGAAEALRKALPPVLEDLRREKGALVILDTATVLARSEDVDVTAEALARYDARLSDVRFSPPPGLLEE